MKNRKHHRLHRKLRIRRKISGTADRPRLSVFKSNRAVYAQLIDDTAGKTIIGAGVSGKSVSAGQDLGKKVAVLAKKHNISTVVFDRNGRAYHGTVKAIADAVREGGITV